MKLNKLAFLITLSVLTGCSITQSNNSLTGSRQIASTNNSIQIAIKRVKKSCRLGTRAVKKMIKNAKKPSYIQGENQKLQSFVLDNGRVVVIDLNNCDNVKTFTFRGDKIVDSKIASGQIYYRSSEGKIYVLIPQKENTYDSTFKIFEIGSTNNRKFKRRVFHSMKRTSDGIQGIRAWSTQGCTQEEVEKSPSSRLKKCSNKHATLEIRGKAIESKRGLFRVNQFSERNRKPIVTRQSRRSNRRRAQDNNSNVYFELVITRPAQCTTVTREVMFMFIFAIEESITYCE